MQFYLVQRSLEYLNTDLVYNIVGIVIKTMVNLIKSTLNFSESQGTVGYAEYESLRQELIVSRITLLRVFEKFARPAVYPQCEGTSLHSLKKYIW